ncbi:MAG: hypothetical protein MRY32_09610 [Rickettsiales bacterium]|nr:hypothetical protein [Rickettsiales bacterium]
MSFIDAKINQGFDEKIVEALAFYMKLSEDKIRVENDAAASEYTLLYLDGVDVESPRLKLRLQELERHEGAQIKVTGDASNADVMIRIEDTVIEKITERKLEKKAAKEAKKSGA